MTEAEWLACEDGPKLADYWNDQFTERKARLVMLACIQRRESINPLFKSVVAVLTAHYANATGADRPFDREEYGALHDLVQKHIEDVIFPNLDDREPEFYALCSLKVAVRSLARAIEQEESLGYLVSNCVAGLSHNLHFSDATGERVAQARLIRDIFGNPFRPVAFNPAWRTDTAVSLARQMYESREFSAMPILADALQDAGCEDEQILTHCRDANQPHVRGCWVCDLVLGKA